MAHDLKYNELQTKDEPLSKLLEFTMHSSLSQVVQMKGTAIQPSLKNVMRPGDGTFEITMELKSNFVAIQQIIVHGSNTLHCLSQIRLSGFEQ